MKIAFVGSHGGHLTELLYLREALDPIDDYFFLTYDNERTRALPDRKYLIRNIGYNYFLMAVSFMRIALIWLRERPDVIISTGAEVAIPAFYLGKVFGAYCIFVEIWATIHTPTQTGRWLYRISDEFYVQWESLLAAYGPKARFAGTIV
jgi:beta-1,4-N-acetylglucosaminyltransferase